MALLAEVAPTPYFFLYVCAHVEVTGCQPDVAAAAVGVRRTDGEIATTDR